jgi:1,4-alpha-glucan branching enzyme
MIQKRFVETNGRTVARVTFTLPSSTKSKTMYLVGDFNNWDPSAHPFRRDTKGRWTLTLDLELGRAYQFRYRRDDEEWMHDAQADAFVFNPHGTYNFIVVTDPDFKRYDGV